MKSLIFLLIISTHVQAVSLSRDWIRPDGQSDPTLEVQKNLSLILDAQAKALSSLPESQGSYRLTEMITDFAVTRSGLFGLSALKSNSGVEMKWKRPHPQESEAPLSLTVDPSPRARDLDVLTESICSLAERSGKVTNVNRAYLRQSLSEISETLNRIDVTRAGHWKASGLRVDLSFSANGSFALFDRAGTNFRLRMEWKLKDLKPVRSNPTGKENRFILQTLMSLDEALAHVPFQGFTVNKVSIGTGSSMKKGLFGLWKYSAGFVGFLVFTPAEAVNFEPHPSIMNGPVSMEDKSFPRSSLVSGLTKTLQTAAFLASHASPYKAGDWVITDIKTINDVSYTGFFGLADFSQKGVVEVDSTRKL